MTTIRRQAVTLLELLIVIAIITLASGVLAISINKAIVDQKFRTEVSKVVDALRLAQDLMLILGTDVRVHFESDAKSEIKYYLELETKLPINIEREILRQRKPLQTIKGVFFRDEISTETQSGKLNVKFLSNGAVMSKGVMRLASTDDQNSPEGTLQSYICLSGYPKPISSSENLEDAQKLCAEIDKSLDQRIAQDTFSKLPDRLKQKEQKEEEGKEKDKDEKNESAKKEQKKEQSKEKIAETEE
jgi:prepilin-type N-terminal cleavage/methylation domain-containing protein